MSSHLQSQTPLSTLQVRHSSKMLSLIRNNATLSKGLMMMMMIMMVNMLEMTMVVMRIILVMRVKPSHQ